MKTYEAIKKRRSIRKFQQKSINLKIIKELLNAARLAPSAANIQPLKYIIIASQKKLGLTFSTLKWAAYIAPKGTPKKDERPMAYVIVLIDKEKEKIPCQRDVGAAVENILLLATAEGLASCWLASVDRKKLANILQLSQKYKIDSVVALGYAKEESQAEEWKGDIKYFKDRQGKMHVPKRKLENLIVNIK
jgi:nitroreductase